MSQATARTTKIVATTGPASEKEAVLKRLLEEGVDIFRFNLKHSTLEWYPRVIDSLQRVS